MGMIFLTSEVMEAVRDQKHPSVAKNINHEGVDLLKNVFNESFSATSKTP